MDTSKFGTAFAAARKAGDKTFEFNGKKFTTETKDDQNNAVTAKFNKLRDAPKGADTTKMRSDAESAARKAPGSGAKPTAAPEYGNDGRRTPTPRMAGMPGSNLAGIARVRAKPKPMKENDRPTKNSKSVSGKIMQEMKAGGAVRGDGCATKGKTKGRTV